MPAAFLGMAKAVQARVKSQSEESDIALFCVLGVFLAIGLSLSYLIFSLMQPTRVSNPGMAAFDPGATRLVPLPHKSDAPALAELPVAPPPPNTSALNALAQVNESPAKPDAKPAGHRRGAARSAPRRDFAQQWSSPSRDWNDNRGWNDNHGWSNNRGWGDNRAITDSRGWHGGPKSWF